MVLGTLLGDGHITKNGSYVAGHGLGQKEYLWLKSRVLSEFVHGRPSLSRKNKLGKRSVRFWTAVAPVFRSLRTLCYPRGEKTITQTWLDRIDRYGFLQAVMWWICDDGTRWGPEHSPSLMACTDGFLRTQVELLREWMTGHGYPCSIRMRHVAGYRPYPTLMFKIEGTVKLMRDLQPLIPVFMAYKVQLNRPDKVPYYRKRAKNGKTLEIRNQAKKMFEELSSQINYRGQKSNRSKTSGSTT